MNNEKNQTKTQSEQKWELASAWSFHMLNVLHDKLEKELKIEVTQESSMN